jgi:hypothetical protein
MRFRPSAYSDAAPLTLPATSDAGTTPAASGDNALLTSSIQAGASLLSTGADIYAAERARADAEKVRRARAKKKKKKKSTPAPAPAAYTPSGLAPAEEPTLPTWAKWGLGLAGAAVVGFVAWKFLGAKEEPPPAPRRLSNPQVRKNSAPKLKPIKPAPASSASMFRDEKTERTIDEAVGVAHGDAYEESDEPSEFDLGDEEG